MLDKSKPDAPLVFPRINGIKPVFDLEAPVCANCAFFVPHAEVEGFCHGKPPLAALQPNVKPDGTFAGHSVVGFRPPVRLADRSCDLFQLKPSPV
jgi:hypothetical protein